MNLDARTLIATALLGLATAGSLHASEADSLPMPSWNPGHTVYGMPIGSGHITAIPDSFEARMQATGSGHVSCSPRVALNPLSGRNADSQSC